MINLIKPCIPNKMQCLLLLLVNAIKTAPNHIPLWQNFKTTCISISTQLVSFYITEVGPRGPWERKGVLGPYKCFETNIV